MPAKIRLQRHGKKGQPFYHIVVADSRAPRDGKFIEKLGTYNPLTNPAQINIKFDRALHWYSIGAVPTDTVRSLLSWMKEKEAKVANFVKANEEKARGEKKTRLEAEKQVNEARAAELAKKRLAEMEAKKAAEAEAAAEAAAEEAPAEEAPAAETEATAEA